MDLDAILNDRALAEVEYMGGKVRFTYRPAMVTLETIGTLQRASDVNRLAAFFADLIASWDLTEKDPDNSDRRRSVPITEDIFKRLPGALVRSMARAIVEDTPTKDEGNGFSGS